MPTSFRAMPLLRRLRGAVFSVMRAHARLTLREQAALALALAAFLLAAAFRYRGWL